MKLVKLTNTNIQEEHICCAFSIFYKSEFSLEMKISKRIEKEMAERDRL